MHNQMLLTLAAVIVLGILSQWLAWRVRVPSILMLLALGFFAGPISGLFFDKPLLNPDELLGDLLLPFVSLSVALILYEGGLTLRFRELAGSGAALWRLVTIGALVTWVIAALAAMIILRLPTQLAILLGAMLVVTGPTVISPLLREIRPRGAAGAIAKWEGIIIDPIGAMLAVLVFEVILLGSLQEAPMTVAMAVVRTIFVSGLLGVASGLGLALVLRYNMVPDFLQSAVSLAMVVAVYTAGQYVQSESGLFAATAMGMALANQRFANVRHIAEFKENLQILLVSSLFILLAARSSLDRLVSIGPASLLFLAALILVARPLSVFVSTWGTSVKRADRIFLALLAPRGIVAAAVSAVFALRLQEAGFDEAMVIVPVTFAVIVGTVVFASIAAPWAANRLGVAERSPQGVLIVGAHLWARAIADALHQQGLKVLLIDTNYENVAAARNMGLHAQQGSILNDELIDSLDLAGIGRLLALTPNDATNVLASEKLARVFGRSETYQVAPGENKQKQVGDAPHVRAHWLFGRDLTFAALQRHVTSGAVVRATPLTAQFDYKAFRASHGEEARVLFIIDEGKRLTIVTEGKKVAPSPGQTIIALLPPEKAEQFAADRVDKVAATKV
nr:hypothetical protein [uncultured bacterium]